MKVNSCVLYDTCFQSIRIFLLGNAHTFDCFGRSGSNTFRHSIQGLPKQLLVTPLPIFGAKRKRKPFKRDKSTSRDFVARSAASRPNKLILNFMRSTCGKSRLTGYSSYASSSNELLSYKSRNVKKRSIGRLLSLLLVRGISQRKAYHSDYTNTRNSMCKLIECVSQSSDIQCILIGNFGTLEDRNRPTPDTKHH